MGRSLRPLKDGHGRRKLTASKMHRRRENASQTRFNEDCSDDVAGRAPRYFNGRLALLSRQNRASANLPAVDLTRGAKPLVPAGLWPHVLSQPRKSALP
jgi:hypothetical protein